MNKTLLEMNKPSLNEEELGKLKKQEIIEDISQYDINDQLALVFNILEENIDALANTKHKQELVEFLNLRKQVKENH